MGARDEVAKEICLEVYKEENKKVKRCIYQSNKVEKAQFGRKINQYVSGNKKLFWEEMSKMNGGKLESSSRIKDGNGRLVVGDDE